MSIEIQLKLKGFDKLKKKLSWMKGFFKSQELYQVLEAAKNNFVSIASRLAPKGKSHLLSQIRGEILKFGSENVSIRIMSAAKYARYVEFKTKAHWIKPVNKKSLFWTEYAGPGNKNFAIAGSGKGKQVGAVFTFASKVWHPGTSEQPFLRPALQLVQPRLERAVQRVLNERLKT